MTALEIVFLPLGAVTLGSAVLAVTTRALVHAALWLVVSFAGLAGCYLVLTAELIAWVQVLIYVGAIVVLLLFAMMLTRAPIGRSADLDSANRPAAVLVATGTAATLVWVILDAFPVAFPPASPAAVLDLGGPPAGDARTMGAAIFQAWVLPFEALSVLLLAALIGAVVLSRTDIGPAGPVAEVPAAVAASVPPPRGTGVPATHRNGTGATPVPPAVAAGPATERAGRST